MKEGLGPLSHEEMVRVRRIGDYVSDHYKKLILAEAPGAIIFIEVFT